MTNFFNICSNRTKRARRVNAFAMLLVWVFALVSGVANACLLEGSGAIVHVEIIEQTHPQGLVQGSVSRHVAIAHDSKQADEAHTSKQPCLKACDDSSSSLTKKYPVGQIDPGNPVIVAVLWSLAEPIRLHYKPQHGTLHAVALLPLRVLYSRLAL